MNRTHTIPVATAAMLCAVRPLDAAVTTYTNKAQWQTAVSNNYHTIDFTGYPQDTIITTQYSNVGATFTDGDDFIHIAPSYPNDGVGLASQFLINNTISVNFAVPQHWIAADFPGSLSYRLYQNGALIYTSFD